MKINLFSFKGRMRRRHYWLIVILSRIIFGILEMIIDGVLLAAPNGEPTLMNILISWMIAIPLIWIGIAVAVQRMHDVNKSGWYFLIPIYNIILAFTNGTKGENKYGPDPKETV